MKVLFLDIDGVLNSRRSCVAFGKFPLSPTPQDKPLLDLVALGLIRKIATAKDVRVVLSSTWRILAKIDAMSEFLGFNIYRYTPILPSGCRGDEIDVWLKANPFNITHYAIVDDDSDMLEHQQANFVLTNFDEGLSYKNYVRLCQLLDLSF